MRRAFTLLELLVTITIIAILAGLMAGGVYLSMERARKAKTRATILKINTLILPLWESYPTRRVPVRRGNRTTGDYRAWLHNCRRDLMRIEMPDRWSDVAGDLLFLPETFLQSGWNSIYLDPGPPPEWRQTWRPGSVTDSKFALRISYQRIYNQALVSHPQSTVDAYESCECLYLVATVGGDRDAVHFADSEIGDTDGDGLKEFHDAWGHPIRWHRWPAGWALREGAEWQQPEPYSSNTDFSTLGPYPLIFSAGPDGIFGVNPGEEADGTIYRYGIDVFGNLNPWTADEGIPPRKIGEPTTDGCFDNITNYSAQAP
jgi:prepilin-type N-terminal cleavage/methylation domain-containing protein